ncbi:MAG TPA: nickel-dependent lactate racemase [Anaerolineae bacterium]|nr:nickel-dependent lactate racemase [Anaerolineae bacterium]HQK12590.1 nickel-dependent lactate racemase [Anaerolineae bacterium]
MPTFELPFKPGLTTHVEVDDRNLLFYAVQRRSETLPDQRAVVENALDHPIGAARLEDTLAPGDRVVIIVDDITRPTPTTQILPPILKRLARAGISDADILIFIALGTHRPMADEELRVKLGDEVLARYRVINRDYRNGDYIDLGTTASGVPIEVNREIVEADFRLAIGNIVPHITSGWGGGSKIILPGVCSQKTVARMHYAACLGQPVLEVIGVRDNRARAEMDDIAGKIGLNFIVNTVLDEHQRMVGVFAGHYIEAHRAAVALAERVMVVPIPKPADIVIASAYPCHFDYWQAIKPYIFAHLAVREGGVLIFLLDGSERLCGDAPSHDEVVRAYLPLSVEEQIAAVERGAVTDIVALNVPLYHAMVRNRVQRTICVTNHLTAEDVRLLAFDRAPDVQTALEYAYDFMGCDATVGIIPFGGETLTRVG